MEMPMEVVQLGHNQHPTKHLQKGDDRPATGSMESEIVTSLGSGSQASQSQTPKGLE